MYICSYTDKESGEHGRAVPLLPGGELGLADIGRMVIAQCTPSLHHLN